LKLRTHINLIVGCLSAAFIALVVWVELDSTRRAVREEIAASNIVAARLLGQVVERYAQAGSAELLPFLESLGRVRSNEIALHAKSGELLYRSPESTYKAGRAAPDWFATFLLPAPPTQTFVLGDGARLLVAANPSRAILDGWDDTVRLLLSGVALLAVLNALVFYMVSRALAPLPVIASGLSRLRQGDLHFRLPSFRGVEANVIGVAFNDMALAVEQKVQAERHAREAEARLEERSEWARVIEGRLEEERRMIARELHDEFAQSITAIRSLSASIAAQSSSDTALGTAANLISSEAAKLYDAMHGLIPRLVPLTLDTEGLAASLQRFVAEWQQRNPQLQLTLQQNLPAPLSPATTLTIYRVVQEALINSLRHGKPSRVDIDVECDAQRALVRVTDDGVGLSAEWSRAGRFGLRGLQERVEKLRGSLQVNNRKTQGVEVVAVLPLEVNP